jgi:microcystin-dependent protein
MSDPFIAEVRMLPYTFAPQYWADCNGQLLSISQNTALFSLVGITYGGNGTTNFGLPDLQSRAPLHVGLGQGPGLSPYIQGQKAGVENVTLLSTQVPAHSHSVSAFTAPADTNLPAGSVMARPSTAAYVNATPNTALANSISSAGGGQPHSNMMPYLTVRFCIALFGVYPSRP